jgi:hypothetical protein
MSLLIAQIAVLNLIFSRADAKDRYCQYMLAKNFDSPLEGHEGKIGPKDGDEATDNKILKPHVAVRTHQLGLQGSLGFVPP